MRTYAVRSIRRVAYYLRGLSNVDNLNSLIEDILYANLPTIEQMVRGQMWQGIDGNSKPIEPHYAPLTKKLKRKKGQPTDRVTLKDTGRFYSNIQVFINNGEIIITSNDLKTEKLVKKYGSGIFKLTDKNMATLREMLRKKLTQLIKEGIEKEIRK